MTFTNFTESPQELQGLDVYGSDREKIGTVGQMYASDPSGGPTWASVKTGLFGLRECMRDDGLQVAFDKATVKDAPNVDHNADEPMDTDQVRELYRYYNFVYLRLISRRTVVPCGLLWCSTRSQSWCMR